MLNIFQIASNDQSIYYLVKIFGPVGDVLPVQTAGSFNLIFGVMFKVFNTIALTAGAFIVVYTTVVGLLATAAEGEFLGKKWSGLWVPIRMVIGTAAVFPATSGYSMIQIVVMWLIVQGIGAADTLWTAVLNYAKSTGSPFAQIPVNTMGIQDNIRGLFQNIVCQESKRAKYDPLGSNYSWWCGSGNNDAFCALTDQQVNNVVNGVLTNGQDSGNQPDTLEYTFGNAQYTQGGGACGGLTYNNPLSNMSVTGSEVHACMTDPNHAEWGPTSLLCLSEKGVQQALESIMPVFQAIAKEYVLVDYQYVQFYTSPITPADPPSAPSVSFNGFNAKQFIPALLIWQGWVAQKLAGNTTGTQNIKYTVEPPQWIKDYCTKGLQLDPNHCCVNGYGCPTSSFPFPYEASDYQDTSYNKGNNANTAGVATQVYLDYALTPYLGPNLDFIDAAVNQLVQQGMTGPYQQYISNLGPQNLSGSIYANMEASGWITAGSYFFQLVQGSNSQVTAVTPSLAVTVPTSEASFGRNSTLAVGASGALLDLITKSVQSSGLGAMVPGLNKAGVGVNYLVTGFVYMLNNSGSNPIVSISTFGFVMMQMAIILFIVTVGLVAVATFLLAVENVMFLGTGWTLNPMGEAYKAILGIVEPIMILFVMAMFSIGALLGIYLPLIPFLIFMTTAIGWFIATIEAMVAAPLIALGILSPGGQHEILGRAEPSVMILFNLFLRPSLITFGFVAAVVATVPILSFFNEGFLRTVGGFMVTPDLIVSMVLMSVYASLILTVISKIFTLIHLIPERALTYIGGPAIQYGEAEALGAAKEAVSGAAAGIGGAAKEGGKAVTAGAEAAGKGKKEFDKQKTAEQARLQAAADDYENLD